MILPVDFSVHLCNKKYELLIVGKFINKTQFISLASVVICSTFLQNELQM